MSPEEHRCENTFVNTPEMAELQVYGTEGLCNCSELTDSECGQADLNTIYKKNSSRGEAVAADSSRCESNKTKDHKIKPPPKRNPNPTDFPHAENNPCIPVFEE